MSAAPEPQKDIAPPTVTSPSALPFLDLDWKRFECLCRDIALATGFTDVYRHGKQGQKQDGIDLYGLSRNGQHTAWQCRRVSNFVDSDLGGAVRDFAEGPEAEKHAVFVVCVACEGNDKSLKGELAILREQYQFEVELWDSPLLTHKLRGLSGLVHSYFGEDWARRFNAPSISAAKRLGAQALLLGPVESHGLTSKVKQAEQLAESSPADAVRLYEEIEQELREHSPRHADQFREKRAFALIDAFGPEASHDEFMRLAVRDLFDRAAPRLSPEVARGLGKLRDQVDPVRRARGEAVFRFRWIHEDPGEISDLGDCFDALPSDDQYAPHIAVLLAEVSTASRRPEFVHDRQQRVQKALDYADGELALRLRVALADANEAGSWHRLISDAYALRFPPREATFVCMRAARWSAWNGDSERAESLYRHAMRFGADAGLDLDVRNALRSLLTLYAPPDRYDDFIEGHQLMLAVDGSDSYLPLSNQTARHSYQSLATGQMPEAHMWTRFRVLEGARSGYVSEEIEAHGVLARVFLESDEPMDALEQAVLGGDQELTKEAASQIDVWPEFLDAMAGAAAPWVRLAALHALDHLGDLAPPQVAARLAHDLIQDIITNPDDPTTVRALYEGLSAVVLEATDQDIERLMPVMRQAVDREPEGFNWTDPGVVAVAARLYRSRPRWRGPTAEILAERLIGAKTSDWWLAITECRADKDALAAAIERTALRTGVNLDEALAKLEHLCESARGYWAERLKYVADHPTGPMRTQTVGDDFEVPRPFLEEQTTEVVGQYVDKLVAIASSSHVLAVNRSGALLIGGNFVDLLPTERRESLFKAIRPLVEPDVELSKHDRHSADSDHPLSRVRWRTGGATQLQFAAGWFLGRSAVNAEQCSFAISLANEWLFSEVPRLQEQAALLLSQPNLSGHGVPGVQLAKHPNSMVRRMAPFMPDVVEAPDIQLARDLATDSSRSVRLSVVDVLHSFDPEARQQLVSILAEDRSAIVRHAAAVTEGAE